MLYLTRDLVWFDNKQFLNHDQQTVLKHIEKILTDFVRQIVGGS